MANLADTVVRQANASRITNNRDGVLPSKRNTDAGKLEVNATISQGRRGNAASEELLRTLGMLTDGISKPLNALGQAQTKNRQDAADALDGADGATAAMNGTPDAERMKASSAYRSWYSKGRADTVFAIAHERIDADITAQMNAKTDVDGSGDWDVADVEKIIADGVKSAGFNEDGTPIDFGSPEGTLQFASKMLDARAKWIGTANEKFATESQAEALNASVGTLVAGFTSNGVYDLDTWMKELPPSVDRKTAMTAALKTIASHAEASDNPAHLGKSLKALTTLLDAKQADGKTPVLGYEAAASVRQQAEAIKAKSERLTDKAEKERHEAGSDAILASMSAGKMPTVSSLQAMVRNGDISPEFAWSQVRALEAAADRQEARANRSADRYERASEKATEQGREWALGERMNTWRIGGGPGSDAEAMAEIRTLAQQGVVLEPAEQAELLAASRAGRKERRATAPARTFWADLETRLKPPKTSGTVAGAYKGVGAAGGITPEIRATVVGHYFWEIEHGKPPAEAHAAALKILANGPAVSNQRADAKTRADALRAKAGKP
jgi:hypothetical protein